MYCSQSGVNTLPDSVPGVTDDTIYVPSHSQRGKIGPFNLFCSGTNLIHKGRVLITWSRPPSPHLLQLSHWDWVLTIWILEETSAHTTALTTDSFPLGMDIAHVNKLCVLILLICLLSIELACPTYSNMSHIQKTIEEKCHPALSKSHRRVSRCLMIWSFALGGGYTACSFRGNPPSFMHMTLCVVHFNKNTAETRKKNIRDFQLGKSTSEDKGLKSIHCTRNSEDGSTKAKDFNLHCYHGRKTMQGSSETISFSW